MNAVQRPKIHLAEHFSVLAIVCAIALIGNRIGPEIGLLEALPGMAIILAMVMAGLVITKIAPFYLPSVAWIALVSIVLTLPGMPGSAFILAHVQKVNVLALVTPVLAYAGLAITRSDVDTFKRSGWKIVIVALLVFVGTFIGSALVAELVMKLQGLI